MKRKHTFQEYSRNELLEKVYEYREQYDILPFLFKEQFKKDDKVMFFSCIAQDIDEYALEQLYHIELLDNQELPQIEEEEEEDVYWAMMRLVPDISIPNIIWTYQRLRRNWRSLERLQTIGYVIPLKVQILN